MTLHGDTVVKTGHGDDTTIAAEARTHRVEPRHSGHCGAASRRLPDGVASPGGRSPPGAGGPDPVGSARASAVTDG